MGVKIIRVVSSTSSVYGIQDTYKQEFKQLGSFVQSAFGSQMEDIIDSLKDNNACFIATDDGVAVGMLVGNIPYGTPKNDSLVETICKSNPGDPEKRYENMSRNDVFGFKKETILDPRAGSWIDSIFVDAKRQRTGAGSALLASFRSACGKEYQIWKSSSNHDWLFYIKKDCTLISARIGDDKKCIWQYFGYNNDFFKRKKLREANSFMNTEELDSGFIREQLESGETAIVMQDQYNPYQKGFKYLLPWNEFVVVNDIYSNGLGSPDSVVIAQPWRKK